MLHPTPCSCALILARSHSIASCDDDLVFLVMASGATALYRVDLSPPYGLVEAWSKTSVDSIPRPVAVHPHFPNHWFSVCSHHIMGIWVIEKGSSGELQVHQLVQFISDGGSFTMWLLYHRRVLIHARIEAVVSAMAVSSSFLVLPIHSHSTCTQITCYEGHLYFVTVSGLRDHSTVRVEIKTSDPCEPYLCCRPSLPF